MGFKNFGSKLNKHKNFFRILAKMFSLEHPILERSLVEMNSMVSSHMYKVHFSKKGFKTFLAPLASCNFQAEGWNWKFRS